ncbi:MAG TPA: hypothetical protein VGO30_23530 [Mycobacterium sp.]|nr:hypothetical protein [Mycobacterium sp.]
MAESEASGGSDYTGDNRLDDAVDTDRLAVPVSPPFTEDFGDPEPGVGGNDGNDFDYLFEDPAEGSSDGQPPADLGWNGWEDARPVEPEPVGDEFVDRDDDRFDAFDVSTWNFKPPPTPWYRTWQAELVLSAVTVAVLALVVSVVLLAFRGPSGDEGTPTADTSSTVPTTVATTPETSAALPPPPPPPPPPPETSASPVEPPVYRQRSEPRQTKEPEIGVTRTPVTRSPLSVAPQPHPSSQRR